MRWISALVLSGTVASSALANAEVTGPAEFLVKLRNGGIYRGEVLEYEPGDHVTIRLARGEIKQFSWKDVVSASAVAPTAASSVSAAPSPTRPASPPRVQPAVSQPVASPPSPAAPAAERPSTQQDDVERHIHAAEFLYQRRETARALREWQLAYQISPRPSFLQQMARCYQQLHRYEDAINLYRRYMHEEEDLDPEKRARLGALVASLREMTVPSASEVARMPASADKAEDATEQRYERRTGLMVSGIVMLAASYSAAALFASLGLAGASTLSTDQYSRTSIEQVKTVFGVLYVPVLGPAITALLHREASYSLPWVLVGMGTQVAGLAMTIAGAQKRPVRQDEAVSVVPLVSGNDAGIAVIGRF